MSINENQQSDDGDDRRKVILSFKPEKLRELDDWREVNQVGGTRTSMFRDAVELFMWLWEKQREGARIKIQNPDGSTEELTRFLRNRLN